MSLDRFNSYLREFFAPFVLTLISIFYITIIGFNPINIVLIVISLLLTLRLKFMRWISLILLTLVSLLVISYTYSLFEYILREPSDFWHLPFIYLLLTILFLAQWQAEVGLDKQERKKRLIWVGSILLLTVGASFVVYRFTNDHDSQYSVTKEYAQKKYDEYRNCNKTEDCVSVGESCPLGCGLTINKANTFKFNILKMKIDEICFNKCMSTGEPYCKNNKCERDVLDKIFN